MEHQDEYAAPEIVDLGTLSQLTLATGFTGTEDGGSKMLIHHEAPSAPAN